MTFDAALIEKDPGGMRASVAEIDAAASAGHVISAYALGVVIGAPIIAVFNVANAIGPLLGGMAIAAGFGLRSTGYVGCALALGGLGVWAMSVAVSGRTNEVLG